MRTVLKLSVGVAFLGSVALSAVPAAADPPSTQVQVLDDATIQDTSCGFLVVETFNGTITRTTFVDQEGDPETIRLHALVEGVLTNPATGATLTSHEALTASWDVGQEDERTWAGLRLRITVPGGGAVFLDAGRLVFDPFTGEVFFEAGPHQLFHGDVEGYCAYLAS